MVYAFTNISTHSWYTDRCLLYRQNSNKIRWFDVCYRWIGHHFSLLFLIFVFHYIDLFHVFAQYTFRQRYEQTNLFSKTVIFLLANSAAAGTGGLWFLVYLPYAFIQPRYETMTRGAKMGTCLLHNIGLALGAQLIGMFEGKGNVLLEVKSPKWNDQFEP